MTQSTDLDPIKQKKFKSVLLLSCLCSSAFANYLLISTWDTENCTGLPYITFDEGEYDCEGAEDSIVYIGNCYPVNIGISSAKSQARWCSTVRADNSSLVLKDIIQFEFFDNACANLSKIKTFGMRTCTGSQCGVDLCIASERGSGRFTLYGTCTYNLDTYMYHTCTEGPTDTPTNSPTDTPTLSPTISPSPSPSPTPSPDCPVSGPETDDFVPRNSWTSDNKNYSVWDHQFNFFTSGAPYTVYDILLRGAPFRPETEIVQLWELDTVPGHPGYYHLPPWRRGQYVGISGGQSHKFGYITSSPSFAYFLSFEVINYTCDPSVQLYYS